MRAAAASSLLLVALGAGPRGAVALIFQLPPDGTWAQYDVQIKGEAGPVGRTPRKIDLAGTCTLSSVGQETIDNAPHRWIEITMEISQRSGPKVGKHTLKLLVPEKYCKRGEDPFAHAVRVYYQRDDGQAQRIESPARREYEIDRFRPVFPGALKNPADLEKRPIDTQLGPFDCAGLTGTSEYEGPLGGGDRKKWKARGRTEWKANYEYRLHEGSPFGVVSLEIGLTGTESYGPDRIVSQTFTEKLTIRKTGTNASSRLPQSK